MQQLFSWFQVATSIATRHVWHFPRERSRIRASGRIDLDLWRSIADIEIRENLLAEDRKLRLTSILMISNEYEYRTDFIG